jgi:hypothetical protein
MKHFINNTEVTPRNNFDIGLSVDFSARLDEVKLTSDTVVLANEGRKLIMDHLQNIGLCEGLPYDIQFNSGALINLYADFTDGFVVKDRDVEIRLKKRFEHDNFFDNAEGLTFDYLATQLSIAEREVGYFILPQDAKAQALMVSLSLFTISISIAQQTKEVAKTTKEFVAIAGYGFSAIGKIIEAGLQLAIQITFLAVLLVQAVKLTQRLKELVFPKLRYFKCSTFLELCKKGCQYLGYSFKSSILEGDYQDLVCLPIPRNRDTKKWYNVFENDLNQAFQNGYPSANDTTPTLGSLFVALEDMFNAKVRIVDGVVNLERWDFYYNKSLYNINSSLVLQSEAQNQYSYDFSRNFNTYLIQYLTDYSDLNTIDRFEYSINEYRAEVNNPANKDLNLLKGYTNISVPFALATPKTSENWLDKLYRGLFEVLNKLSKKNIPKENRIGYLQLTQQYFSITKAFIHNQGTKISSVSDDLIKPSKLWDNFHEINSPLNFQFIIKDNVKIQMNGEKFNQLLGNNYAVIDGIESEILKMEYFDELGYAEITFRQPNNLFKVNAKITKVY